MFKRTHVPPVAFLTIFLGGILGVLILAIVRVQHDITLPYCETCWRRIKKSNLMETLSMFSFFVGLVLGVVLMLNLNSGIVFWFPLIASVGLIVWAQRSKRKAHPKYKKVDRKQAVVAAGVYGDIVFSKVTSASVRPSSSR